MQITGTNKRGTTLSLPSGFTKNPLTAFLRYNGRTRSRLLNFGGQLSECIRCLYSPPLSTKQRLSIGLSRQLLLSGRSLFASFFSDYTPMKKPCQYFFSEKIRFFWYIFCIIQLFPAYMQGFYRQYSKQANDPSSFFSEKPLFLRTRFDAKLSSAASAIISFSSSLVIGSNSICFSIQICFWQI